MARDPVLVKRIAPLSVRALTRIWFALPPVTTTSPLGQFTMTVPRASKVTVVSSEPAASRSSRCRSRSARACSRALSRASRACSRARSTSALLVCATTGAGTANTTAATKSTMGRFMTNSSGTRRQQRRRAQQLDFLVERLIQLVGEEPAGRILRQGGATLRDGRVDHGDALLEH